MQQNLAGTSQIIKRMQIFIGSLVEGNENLDMMRQVRLTSKGKNKANVSKSKIPFKDEPSKTSDTFWLVEHARGQVELNRIKQLRSNRLIMKR